MHRLDIANEPPFIKVDGTPHDCVYLPNETARLTYVYPRHRVDQSLFDRQLALGQRRSGPFLYYMNCERCRACQPTRVLVRDFDWTTSLRRVKKRGDLAITTHLASPQVTDSRVYLYNLHRVQRGLGDEGSIAGSDEYREFLVDSCCHTMEMCYYFNQRLIGCTIVDVGKQSLSAVYTYFDPSYSKLSLGTYAVLKLIEFAQANDMTYVYLGLYVELNTHLKYKARFTPQERLIKGEWIRYDESTDAWADSSRNKPLAPQDE